MKKTFVRHKRCPEVILFFSTVRDRALFPVMLEDVTEQKSRLAISWLIVYAVALSKLESIRNYRALF